MMEKTEMMKSKGGIAKFQEMSKDWENNPKILRKIIENLSEKIDELQAKAAAYDRLMSALTSILTKAKEVENLSPSNVDWWCPNCGTTSCTNDGRCTKCGAEIEQFQVEPFKDSLHELIDGLLSVLPDGFESNIPSKVKSKDIPSREDV